MKNIELQMPKKQARKKYNIFAKNNCENVCKYENYILLSCYARTSKNTE